MKYVLYTAGIVALLALSVWAERGKNQRIANEVVRQLWIAADGGLK